jgi:hypothetical protein
VLPSEVATAMKAAVVALFGVALRSNINGPMTAKELKS